MKEIYEKKKIVDEKLEEIFQLWKTEKKNDEKVINCYEDIIEQCKYCMNGILYKEGGRK